VRKDFPDSAKSVCKYLSAMYADCKLQSLQRTAFKPLQSAKYWKNAEKAV